MKKCKITILKTLVFEDMCGEYMPANWKEASTCPVFREGGVYVTGGMFGNGKPDGFCEYAWQAVQIIACTLAGGGRVFGEDYNIACCNDGLRPVIMKLETVDE